MIFLDIVTMETVKRKINALKDEIERKDEGKTIDLRSHPNFPSPRFPKITLQFPFFFSRYYSPPRKVEERTNGKGEI